MMKLSLLPILIVVLPLAGCARDRAEASARADTVPTASAPPAANRPPAPPAPPAPADSTNPAPPPICAAARESMPLNEQYATCAWTAFNNRDYQQALSVTEQCLDEFEQQALRDQRDVAQANRPTPDAGTAVTESQKREILARGVLNDVAACQFVRGRALERLQRTEEAISAYQGVQRFPDARVWDARPQIFWSPAQRAADRIAGLR
jgi:hypothetical protein